MTTQQLNPSIVLPYYDSEDDASEDEIAFNVDDTAMICKSPGEPILRKALQLVGNHLEHDRTPARSSVKSQIKSSLKKNVGESQEPKEQNVSMDSEAGFLPNMDTSLIECHQNDDEDQCGVIPTLRKNVSEVEKENSTPLKSASKVGFKSWKAMIMSLSPKKTKKADDCCDIDDSPKEDTFPTEEKGNTVYEDNEEQVSSKESTDETDIALDIVTAMEHSVANNKTPVEKNRPQRLSFAEENKKKNDIDSGCYRKERGISFENARPKTSLSPSTVASSVLSPEPTIDLGALGISLGISNGYSASENKPIYSESELQAKIDAAVCDATSKIRIDYEGQLVECRANVEASNQKLMQIEIQFKEKQNNLEKIIENIKRSHMKEKEKLMGDVNDAEVRGRKLAVDEHNEKYCGMEKKLKEIESNHAQEIEEMLLSLDGVESDYKAKLEKANNVIAQKDAVISAVGMQVVESNTRCEMNVTEINRLEAEILELKDEIKTKNNEIIEIERKVDLLKVGHEERLKEETAKRTKAVEKMKLDMRRAAEEQFAEANKFYLKLKSDFEESQEECRRLKKQVDNSNTEGSRWKAKQATLEADIAKLKAGKLNITKNNLSFKLILFLFCVKKNLILS